MVSKRKGRRLSGEPKSGTRPATGTYQTRVSNYSGVDLAAGDAALSAYGELYGRVQRKLFAEVAASRSATSLKSAYLECHLAFYGRGGGVVACFSGIKVVLEWAWGRMSRVLLAPNVAKHVANVFLRFWLVRVFSFLLGKVISVKLAGFTGALWPPLGILEHALRYARPATGIGGSYGR